MIPFLLALAACNPAPSAEDLEGTRGGRVDVWFNAPGTNRDNMWDPDFIDQMVAMIDGAQATIDVAVMGFSNKDLINAFVRADNRGIKIRMVGDGGHLMNSGYVTFRNEHIPMTVGNSAHIMHDKFMVVDSRFVFCSTANWSDSDLKMNINNAVVIDSPEVAADFTTEFEQMFAGVFGADKVELPGPRSYQVGDTTIEVWFSPNEDAMGRILEYVNAADESVHFSIFAFTKDQLGSALVRDSERGLDVAGVIDQSQLHSNGQYHEVYRLLAFGVPVRMDGDDNSVQPGDYQAGGGRLHSKTMVIDSQTDHPVLLTGSFNWSSSATVSNDEYLMVMKDSPRIAQIYEDYWNLLWDTARPLGEDTVASGDVEPGDVVINEVMWYGVNSGDADGFDEFLELRNTTDHDIRLDLWQISTPLDFVMGFPPGSVLPANGLFTVLDHTREIYQEGAPQDELSAFANGNMVLNPYNDNRQSRLYLKDGNLQLFLKDPDGELIDQAGDGGAAFVGGPDGSIARSMERNDSPGDGADPDAWHSCSLDEGGANVNDDYKSEIAATPGESNSP